MADSQNVNISGANAKSRVFRVRNLPAHVDRLSAVELLCQSIDGAAARDIRLSSLAYDVDVWSWLRTKTATITLHERLRDFHSSLSDGECAIPVPGLAKPLIIDHHFQGVTPLNHVPEDEHNYDCLIISGLASHPFGSWQTHGHDKSFMWIRDELPQRLPGVRFLTYGYDTTLVNSTSFQLIPDLAISLVHTVKALGWSASSAKPVLFLAHSLGGVVLKQAMAILAGGGLQERSILTKIKGAIFFGVPSKGMNVPDIFEMLGDQPNVALVNDLSDQSDFLSRLDEQFGNISYIQKLQFFWAFETKVTPSLKREFKTGRPARTGHGTVMVPRESATRNLYHLQPSWMIQIDENHSDMVKFGIGHKLIGILASKLKNICALSDQPGSQLALQPTRELTQYGSADSMMTSDQPGNIGNIRVPGGLALQPEWKLPGFWDSDEIVSSLRVSERDRRLGQINQKVGDTFNWAYDDSSTGLSEWLQKGTGIFWIHGKPGSGKSTLMKYLYEDPRTEELLRAGSWQSRARLTKASFFFHHRGRDVQKSFEGFLKSLLSQILEQEKSLSHLIHPILTDQYRTLIAAERLESLEEDIWALLDDLQIHKSSEVTRKVDEIVTSQIKITRTRRLGIHLRRMVKDFGVKVNSRSEDPYDEAEFDDSEFLSNLPIDQEPSEQEETLSQSSGSKTWVTVLSRILQRHYHRWEIKTGMLWTRVSLEDCLRQLVGQSLFKMDLVLFLDALDEYDGRPEFIATFLQDLVQQPADPNKQSLTVVRILFSSRPWKALNDEFAACPGFQIHDHTGNDIFEFCVATIPSEQTAKLLLAPLTTDIVRRARGVFLWVELVMRDLAAIVLRRPRLQDTQALEQELRQTLDAIPDELDDYYQVILQRIPLGNRWESYVVLETLCRSDEDIDIRTLIAILKCAPAKLIAEAKRKLKEDSKMPPPGLWMEWGERYVRALAGGLVEIGGVSDEGEPVLQFMHQTVKQFVEGPWFRYQLLGHNVGTFVTENGHSFIAKHLFVLSVLTDRFVRHAREAEATTGFSQYDFFSTAPPNYLSSVRNARLIRLPSMAVVSVSAGLQLCVRHAWEADPSCIQRDSAKILSTLCGEAKLHDDEDGIDRILNMTKLVVEKGLSIDGADESLLDIAKSTWSANSRCKSFFENMALILLDAVKLASTETALAGHSSQSNPTQPNATLSSKAEIELLHQATPKLARALLARGFSPNAMDTRGNTPIDFFVKLSARLSLPEKHDIVSQLASNGGLLNHTRRSRWEEFEKLCVSSGLDTTVYRQAEFPLWCSSGKPARKHRSLGVFLSQRIQS